MTDELTVNKKQGQEINCPCRECNRSTKHKIISEATLIGTFGSYDCEIYWATEYQIVCCLGCETLAFRRTNSNSEDGCIQISEDEWIDNIHEDIYPSPYKGRQPISDSHLLPSKIERIYKESLTALNSRQEVLCGIGVRAIIETVCKDKAAVGSNLYKKIDSLVSQGVLTQDGANILQKLRTLGNNAAHEVKPHTQKELGLAFDVVDHLLLGVYTLPENAKKTFK